MTRLATFLAAAVDHYQTYWASRSMAAILNMSPKTRIRRLQLKILLVLALTGYLGYRLKDETGFLRVLPYLAFISICLAYVWKRKKILGSATN